jgi:hypothetical protein
LTWITERHDMISNKDRAIDLNNFEKIKDVDIDMYKLLRRDMSFWTEIEDAKHINKICRLSIVEICISLNNWTEIEDENTLKYVNMMKTSKLRWLIFELEKWFEIVSGKWLIFQIESRTIIISTIVAIHKSTVIKILRYLSQTREDGFKRMVNIKIQWIIESNIEWK